VDAGSGRAGRIDGWSGAPVASRLPALLLVGAVGLGAVVRPVAPFVFVGLLTLYLFVRRAGDRSVGLAATLAALLPAAAILVWRSLPQPAAEPTGADCTNLLAPPAVWRFLEGAIGLAVVVTLVVDRRASLGQLGLRRGSRSVRGLALLSLLVIAPLALSFGTLVGGSTFGGMFFGTYTLDTSQPAALLPARVRGVELAGRGAGLPRRDAHVAGAGAWHRRGEPRPGDRVRAVAHGRRLRPPRRDQEPAGSRMITWPRRTSTRRCARITTHVAADSPRFLGLRLNIAASAPPK
jgi:hypothetical protein